MRGDRGGVVGGEYEVGDSGGEYEVGDSGGEYKVGDSRRRAARAACRRAAYSACRLDDRLPHPPPSPWLGLTQVPQVLPRFCLEPWLLPHLPIPHGGVRFRAGGTLTELALAELALAAARAAAAAVRLALHATRATAAARSASSAAAASSFCWLRTQKPACPPMA